MPVNVYPIPQEGQSVSCYIRTLAHRNCFPSVAQFKKRYWGNSQICEQELSANDIAAAIGFRKAHLDKLRLVSTHRKSCEHNYGHLTIPSHQIRRTEMYCPACFREQGYVLAKWQIGWLPMCLKHERPLIELDHEAEGLSSTQSPAPGPKKDRRHYDLFGFDDVCQIQQVLEEQLEKEADGYSVSESIIDIVNLHLLASTGNKSLEQIKTRRRRYAQRYFPFKSEDCIKFLSILPTEFKTA